MTDDSKSSGDLERREPRRNWLDVDATRLSGQERAELERRIIDEQLSLDVKDKIADRQFRDSSRDMARDLQYVKSLDESVRGDFQVDAKYQSASGETSVQIKRNTNFTYTVIAVVVGIVILYLLGR